ncbi:MAG: hypothetical protein HY779_00215, partial [Rubrobacteridae bacterium]|nr:hypothetical protein [Rubrobacteridae bacterium]
MQANRPESDYFKQKLNSFKSIEKFLENEREAIVSSNLELLNDSLRNIEELQIKIDNLDRKNKSHLARLSAEEKSQLNSLLTRIVDLNVANEQLLT